MQIIRFGKDVWFTEQGHNVSDAVNEIIKKSKSDEL